MIYICKPKKLQIYVNTKKKTIAQIKAETGCDAIINGGLYNMSKFIPNCHLKVDGKVLGSDQYKYWGYGWDKGDLPVLVNDYSNLDNYICCCCMVRNGKTEKMYYDSSVGRSTYRTAIGTFPDGRLWLYAEKAGKTPVQLQDLALKAGVKDAIMLDGGGSTQCIFPSGKVTSSRKVHNYICVWEDKPVAQTDTSKKTNVDTPLKKDESLAGTYKINTKKGLHIRTGANSKKTSLGVLLYGAKVENYGFYNVASNGVKWLYVKTADGKVGYCSSAYLKKC